MKSKRIIFSLIITTLLSGYIGVNTIYNQNKILHISHHSNISKDEEFRLYNKIIEMVGNNNINKTDIVKAIESQKKQRTAAHKVMKGVEEYSFSMITALIVLGLVQIGLVIYFLKKTDGKI